MRGAQSEVLLQTPYLVMSDAAQDLFRELHERKPPPQVIVSTNSLAATDNAVVYSMSFKYKRRYLREFGFRIYEYKPFPEDAPVDYAALMPDGPPLALRGTTARRFRGPSGSIGPLGIGSAGRDHAPAAAHRVAALVPQQRRRPAEPLPLKRAGVRMGLHAKSMVIDNRIGVIGTHNFDPRSENYNTESAVVIDDAAFAQALAASIRRDMSPENSWVIAPRAKPPVLSGPGLQPGQGVRSACRCSTSGRGGMPPATSSSPAPIARCRCAPNDPAFHRCYEAVGDFPEVNVGPKWLYTRLLTAFGAGLVPIL